MSKLQDRIAQLTKLAQSGEMETTLVLLPITPDATSPKQWSDKLQELRRRQAEMVFSSVEESAEPAAPTSSNVESHVFTLLPRIPACFKSEDSCIQGTADCSGHGSCLNRFANKDGSEGKEVCYTCHCLGTYSQGRDEGSVIHWGGRACSKQDISVQFWLFAGFTLAMVSILYLAIGMLFSVGEEKLPGVIGAGVSKSK